MLTSDIQITSYVRGSRNDSLMGIFRNAFTGPVWDPVPVV